MNKTKFFLQSLCMLFFCLVLTYVQAQPAESYVKVLVGMDHTNWTYKSGENVKFTVSVFQNGIPLKEAEIRYEIGLEKLTPTTKATKIASNGILEIDGGTLNTPGFLRCIAYVTVAGTQYRGFATAGFDPDKIMPTVANPTDFDDFWIEAKKGLSAVPIDAVMTLMPERCTEKVNVYHVSLQNMRPGTRLYGILAMPKKEGKYPALLKVPGAGVRGYGGDIANAEKGMITFEIGIHGIPVNMDASVYRDLSTSALQGYQNYNMDDKDRFYFKRVYLGCVRANDFLVSLPQYDGTNLAVTGGSQGGALSIVTAALDSRVKWLAAYYPALSDVTGYLQGRAGGWPHYFDAGNIQANNIKEKVTTIGYYDVVNFARRVHVPGFYAWGYNDEVCPPTSMHAAYNVISAPKKLSLYLDSSHWTYGEERNELNNWLLDRLIQKKPLK